MEKIEFVRCKSCGYIMEKNKVTSVCPACNVPASMFEPFNDNVSPKRKKILDLHLHPVMVHLPQAFAPFILACAGLTFALNGTLRTDVLSAVKILSFVLPFAVAGSFASGLFDGKIRFRRILTPVLKIKIIAGSVFMLSSALSALLTAAYGMTHTVIIAVIAANTVNIICSAVLGKLGAGLLNAKFPG